MMQASTQFVQLAQTLCYDLARAEKATDGKKMFRIGLRAESATLEQKKQSLVWTGFKLITCVHKVYLICSNKTAARICNFRSQRSSYKCHQRDWRLGNLQIHSFFFKKFSKENENSFLSQKWKNKLTIKKKQQNETIWVWSEFGVSLERVWSLKNLQTYSKLIPLFPKKMFQVTIKGKKTNPPQLFCFHGSTWPLGQPWASSSHFWGLTSDKRVRPLTSCFF